jgi:hypothetical protein
MQGEVKMWKYGAVIEKADFLSSGGGEMEKLIGAFDWSKTSLGPLDAWPTSLNSYL